MRVISLTPQEPLSRLEMLFASKFSPRQKKNDKREFLRVSSK